MEPLKDILTIYEDKEKILKYFLPESSTRHLDEYEYVQDLDTLFLNDKIIMIRKSTGEIYKKGTIIKITGDKITIKNGMNISLPDSTLTLLHIKFNGLFTVSYTLSTKSI